MITVPLVVAVAVLQKQCRHIIREPSGMTQEITAQWTTS